MESTPPGETVVLVISDPGVPTRRVECIKDRVEKELDEKLHDDITLVTRTDAIRLRPDNTLDLDMAQQISSTYAKVDVTMMLTEMPRHTSSSPLIAEAFPTAGLAVIACPTLGPWATKRRLVRILGVCAARVAPNDPVGAYERGPWHWSRWTTNGEQSRWTLHAHTLTGGARTVMGMVVANEPLRTIPRMSSALATAGAAGAFGIFYNSIWQMSSYLSTMRLIGIGFLAMLAMVTWLLVSNRLWDQPVQERLSTVVFFYNLSTIVTLFLCVAALYLALFVLILVGAVAVIDPGYMQAIIGKDASFSNYLELAWLSATLGVVAGGLGSSFDSHTDLRRLTHGQRERQRRYTE